MKIGNGMINMIQTRMPLKDDLVEMLATPGMGVSSGWHKNICKILQVISTNQYDIVVTEGENKGTTGRWKLDEKWGFRILPKDWDE